MRCVEVPPSDAQCRPGRHYPVSTTAARCSLRAGGSQWVVLRAAVSNDSRPGGTSMRVDAVHGN